MSESLATAAIEGEQLKLDDVRSSIAKRLGLPEGKTTRMRAVEGLLDMMQDATTGWDQPLSAERLCGWQNALFPTGFSGIHRVVAGAFRTHAEPMQIVRGPSWNMDGLLRAGIAHLWFESIHPFEDGNDRVGRALADLALAQELRSDSRLVSLATELSAARDANYTELHTARRANADNTRWLLWFCGRFEAACERSSALMHAALDKARYWARHAGAGFDHNQRKVMNRLLDAGPRGFEGELTTAKYVRLTGVSRATAFRDLAALVAAGALETTGAGKATRYFIKLPGWEPLGEKNRKTNPGRDI